jgi:hypothetical protein
MSASKRVCIAWSDADCFRSNHERPAEIAQLSVAYRLVGTQQCAERLVRQQIGLIGIVSEFTREDYEPLTYRDHLFG